MRAGISWRLLACGACAVCLPASAAWDPSTQLDEFKVKREAVYEFVQRPAVTRDGDLVTIAFESKGLCDVTVAIEDPKGRIVRHLASGVLGPNAPQPFLKDSRKQAVVWDGKDDQGVYIDDKKSLTVRGSLGLKAQFERTLFWSPKKPIAPGNRPNFAAAPEGVYVHEGGGIDHPRLFDHQGNYVRTVYPFPPEYSSAVSRSGALDSMQPALAGVKGLEFAGDQPPAVLIGDPVTYGKDDSHFVRERASRPGSACALFCRRAGAGARGGARHEWQSDHAHRQVRQRGRRRAAGQGGRAGQSPRRRGRRGGPGQAGLSGGAY
jgi:hypothetical protein